MFKQLSAKLRALLSLLLTLLDRLAGKWLDWRLDGVLQQHPELSKGDFHRAEANQRGWEIEAFSPAVPILADQCVKLMTEMGARNYVEFQLLPRLDRGLRPVVVTVRWANGLMPSQKVSQLEAELDQIRDALTQCGQAAEFPDAVSAIWYMASRLQSLEAALSAERNA